MSEVNSTQPHSSQLDMMASDRYQRWRLVKDKLVARAVVVGGLSYFLMSLYSDHANPSGSDLS